MLYGYLRTSLTAVDGQAGDAPLNPTPSPGRRRGPAGQRLSGRGHLRPGQRPPGLDRAWTLRCAAAIPSPWPPWTGSARNRVDLVGVVESLHRRGVGIASLAPAES